MLQDHGYGAIALHGVLVYTTAFTDSHCAYPRRDGQAELSWVDGFSLPLQRQSLIPVLTGPIVG